MADEGRPWCHSSENLGSAVIREACKSPVGDSEKLEIRVLGTGFLLPGGDEGPSSVEDCAGVCRGGKEV